MSLKLSALIRQRLASHKSAHKPDFWGGFYFPTPSLVHYAIFFTIVIGTFSQFNPDNTWFTWLLAPSPEINSTLVSIHTGIGTVIFALLIFVAESLRDEDAADRARVLLRESMLFPLTLLEILVFFLFILGKVNRLAILPVVIVGILTIISVYRIVSVLLNKTEFAQKRNKALRERLRQSLALAVDTRIGQNIFLEKINADPCLEYRMFPNKRRQDRTVFTASKYGTITDINFDILKKVTGKLHQLTTTAEGREIPAGTTNIFEDKTPDNRHITLNIIKLYHEQVTPTDNNLCFIDSAIHSPEKKEEIEELLNRAFIIEKHSGFTEAVQNDISNVKDQMLSAIEARHTGKAEHYTKIYIELFEEFLEYLSSHKGTYTAEQARSEIHSIRGGWQEVTWLYQDIREIYIKAIASEDFALAQEVSYLPIAISKKALEFKDHYIFQTFIGFSRLLYLRASQCGNKEFREAMQDLASQQLTELAHYVIQPRLRETAELAQKEETAKLKGFAIHLFTVFQGLLKDSLDKNDFEYFSKYKKAAAKLFDHITDGELDNPVGAEISERRQQLFFHLASWITDINKVSPAKHLNFQKSIDEELPSSLIEIDSIFWKTHTREAEEFWGWSFWELEADGEVRTIDVFGRLERYYIIKVLEALSKVVGYSVTPTSIPPRKDFIYLTAPDGGFGVFLNELKTNPTNWTHIISSDLLAQIPLAEELLESVKAQQKAHDLEFKRRAPISTDKVKEFTSDVIAGINDVANLRNVLQFHKLISYKLKTRTESDKRFGINTVFDKDVFIENSNTYSGGFGKRYGEGIASGETAHILDKVDAKCTVFENFDSLELSGNGWIAITTDFDWSRFFEKGGIAHESKWESNPKPIPIREYEGTFELKNKKIRVFHAFRRDNKKQFVIINTKHFGRLLYFNPLNPGEDKVHLNNELYINVQSFSENETTLNKIIQEPPEWLKSKGDIASQRNHLLELVLINVLEKFEYKPAPDFKGFSLNITKPHRYSK